MIFGVEPADRYELLDEIGSGGMATVWRARDRRLGRIVAFKRPHPAPRGSTVLARFAREARVAATVSHQHLVAVYDAGEDGAGPFLVMELIDGPSLDSVRVDTQQVATIGAQVAAGLAALHAAGIVHGDVKPGNILLAPDGAKLTDFGVARPIDGSATLTQPGVVLATPAYAAPETLRHGHRTMAADVYSLGAVVNELVTGSRPVANRGLVQHTTPAMPTDPAWAAILERALASDPDRRPTAAALSAQLASVAGARDAASGRAGVRSTAATTAVLAAGDPPASVGSPPKSTARTASLVFAAGLLVGGVGLIAVVAAEDDAVGSSATTASSPPPDQRTTLPVATTVGTTPPSVATTLATTAPPTSRVTTTTVPSTTSSVSTAAPPSTAPPTSEASSDPPEPVEAARGALVDRVGRVPRSDLKQRDERTIVALVDEAIEQSGGDDRDEAATTLVDAAREIDEHIDGTDDRNEAIDLLIVLADELGVDTDELEGFR